MVETVGAFIIAVGLLVFFANISCELPRATAPAGRVPEPADPWDARSLEWITAQPDAAPQLRRDPHRSPTSTSSGTASTPRTTTAARSPSPSSAEVAQTGRRPPAPAGPVVLADHRRLRPAGHRLRPDLQPRPGLRRRRHRRSRGVYGWILEPAFDARRRPRPRSTTTATHPTATARQPPRPRCRRRSSEPAETQPRPPPSRGGPRWLTTAAIDARSRHRRPRRGTASKPGEHGWTSTGLTNEKLGHVAVPRHRVPALRRADLDLPALQEPGARGQGPTPHELYDIPFTSCQSFVLLMSSLTMVLAVAVDRPGRPPQHAGCGCSPRPCSARSSSPARSTSSRRSSRRAWASPPTWRRRPSSRSPASTASTSRSASSC